MRITRTALLVALTMALVGGPAVAEPPGSERLMFQRGRDLMTIRTDGADAQQVLPYDGFYRAGIDWSADGKRVAYTKPSWYAGACSTDCPTPNQVWAYDMAKSTERLLGTVAGFAPIGLQWSPDGKAVAFWGNAPGDDGPSVWVLDIATGAQRRLASGHRPTWSPDGDRLAFTCDLLVCTIGADGSGLASVPGSDRMDVDDWSPDGTALLATRSAVWGTGVGMETVVLLLDGRVERSFPGIFGARWSRDGSSLAYVRSGVEVLGTVCLPDPCPQRWGVWMVGRDGSNPRQVVGGQFDRTPQFAR